MSVITISQSIPIAGTASVTISLDITRSDFSAAEMISHLEKLDQVISVHLDAME